MTIRSSKIIFWLSIFGCISIISYLLADVLTPFLIAFLFAYILQPLIDTITHRYNLSRSLVNIIVFFAFISILSVFIIILSPIIYRQVTTLIKRIPYYQVYIQEKVDLSISKLNEENPTIASKISEGVNMLITNVFDVFYSFANHLWHYTMITINFVTIAVLVPIILYYFLRDWQKMTDHFESILPQKGKGKIDAMMHSISQLIAAYVRGQLNICIILAIYYIIGLSLIGLDFALLLGIMSGFLIIIPFIGALISFFIIIISTYLSFGFNIELAMVTALFIIGHGFEGYIFAPRIIGNKIGLHPLWIMFSVLSFGALFGVIGVIFAVPMASILKLLILNGIDYYRASNIFKN